MNHDDYLEKMTDSIFLTPDAQIAHHAAVLRDILAELERLEKDIIEMRVAMLSESGILVHLADRVAKLEEARKP